MSLSRFRGQIVLMIDILLIFTCNFILFFPSLLRDDIQLLNLVLHIGLLTVCVLVFQLVLRTYNSLWRYAESREYFALLAGMSMGFLLYTALNLLLETNRVWIIQALTGTALALLCMLAERFLYRMYRMKMWGHSTEGRSQVAIIGAGMAGVSLLGELVNNPQARYVPYCMVDDAPDKIGKRVQGIPVRGPVGALPALLQNTPVTEIILAIPNLSPERRTEILRLCATTNCRLHILSDPMSQLKREGTSLAASVREVQIEDLLGRQSVSLDNRRIATLIEGKTVLVTGGGGSIGSELCRQIAGYHPRRLERLDIAENTTYDLQNDLLHLHGADFPLSVEIASVRDRKKIDRIFAKYQPQLVFHAAAHKHVPLMENCPEEAIKNNVFGTYNTASAARRYGAEKFVLISTDKAVNPTNIMGTTKYLCEQVLQGLRSRGRTEFAAVRFGNVLGSDGSVIPLFKKQIAYGGPVTITDKRIIRYFMTIPEAVQLVLEAGSLARSGEVYVLDMGEPVHILDLAEKLIRLSGYTPYVDIKIEGDGCLSQTDMDAILSHAKSKKIEIVPCINTPGHMGAILAKFPDFKWQGSNSLDIENVDAVAFALALVEKYAAYFEGKGCNYFNLGADEFANDIYTSGGMGFGALTQQGKYQAFVDYVNAAAQTVINVGMIPRAFNDGMYYNDQDMKPSSENSVIGDIQVCYWSSGWSGYAVASAAAIAQKGHQMINTHGDYYYVCGGSSPMTSGTIQAEDFDPARFPGESKDLDASGAMFCIWCDDPTAEEETAVLMNAEPYLTGIAGTLPNEVTASVPDGKIKVSAAGLTALTAAPAEKMPSVSGTQ